MTRDESHEVTADRFALELATGITTYSGAGNEEYSKPASTRGENHEVVADTFAVQRSIDVPSIKPC